MKIIMPLLMGIALNASENNVLEIPTLSGVTYDAGLVLEQNIGYDQGRTFAVTALYQNNKNRILFNYDMLTAFATTTANGIPIEYTQFRVDRIDLIASHLFGDASTYIRVGLGSRYYGNVGGYYYQKIVHEIVRPTYKVANDMNAYEKMHDISLIGQVVVAGITQEVGYFSLFGNVNGDISSEKEYNLSGFCGVSLNKTVFIGPYINAEKNPYSETTRLGASIKVVEDTYGARVSVSYKSIYLDFSYKHDHTAHCKVGLIF